MNVRNEKDIDKIIHVMENEKQCVERNIKNICNGKCAECDLLLEDEDIITAYDFVISVLNVLSNVKTLQIINGYYGE